MKSLIRSACAASIAAIGITAAHSATISTGDGLLSPFAGFDWDSAGSSMTTGAIVDGGSITTVYMATAVNIKQQGGGNFTTPNLDEWGADTGTYEITVFATITEDVNCLDAGCTIAQFTATGGTWQIFYDDSPDANLITGAGITNGDVIVAGTINPGFAGTFTVSSPTCGAGIFTFTGDVTATNNTYINPDLDASNAASTLQFGSDCVTDWTAPTSFAAPGGGTQAISGLLLQADANQSFIAQVPEPGSLALLGGALGLVGWATRRRKAA